MRSSLRRGAQTLFGPFGLAVEPTYHTLAAHRRRLFDRIAVSRVIDVGADVGQYAGWPPKRGYRGEVVSYEANPAAAARLRENARSHHRWRVEAVALAAESGSGEFHVMVDSLSTSMLDRADDTCGFMKAGG